LRRFAAVADGRREEDKRLEEAGQPGWESSCPRKRGPKSILGLDFTAIGHYGD
jgi:hypothetical protein